jgi:hypothetical protein
MKNTFSCLVVYMLEGFVSAEKWKKKKPLSIQKIQDTCAGIIHDRKPLPAKVLINCRL